MEIITSTKNPLIKKLLDLEKPRIRKESGLFVIEGFREIDRAEKSGYVFDELYFCPELESFLFQDFVDRLTASRKITVSAHVFSRIAYRDNHQGILATAKMKDHGLEGFHPPKNGLYLVIESVEKPGNLGALLRTADAAGANAVFVCDNQTDLYNPNVVRSSLGCLFSNRVIQIPSEDAIYFLRQNKINIIAAALQDSELYYTVDLRNSAALVMGSEASGLTEVWRENADQIIRIPMTGIADSLNVSVSAAILLFEAVRQRNNRLNKAE